MKVFYSVPLIHLTFSSEETRISCMCNRVFQNRRLCIPTYFLIWRSKFTKYIVLSNIISKGQIMSECIYEIIDFPKYVPPKNLIDFCPGRFYRLGTCDLFWLFSIKWVLNIPSLNKLSWQKSIKKFWCYFGKSMIS